MNTAVQEVSEDRGYIVYDEPDGLVYGWCPECGQPFGTYRIYQPDFMAYDMWCLCTRAT